MLFNSATYIFLFLPVVVLVYFALNRRQGGAAGKTWLVLASLFFYAYWNPVYLPLLLLSISVNLGFVTALHRLDVPARARARKATFIAGIAFNLGLLGYFKYADFFIGSLNPLLGDSLPLLHIALPLAISFVTFQKIAYLSDCHQRNAPRYSVLDYCLFVSFFPQLIAGPIVHHHEIMPQFNAPASRQPDWDNIARGLFIFFIGLFKKCVIADSFSGWANAGYGTAQAMGLADAWATSLSYTLQLYFDFSGYTDMAIGSALLFNIRLPINFHSPYKALNIRDFWTRWHLTLSRWLRDYLYIPLGGNRKGELRSHINLGITFLLGGLWHGAAWTFVLWGALHGGMQVIHRFWERAGYRMPKLPAWLLFFLFLNATMVVFRAESLHSAIQILSGMAGLNTGTGPHLVAEAKTWRYIAIFGLVCLFAPNSMQMLGWLPYQGRLSFRTSLPAAAVTAVVAVVAVYFVLTTNAAEFLYFNF